MFTCIFIISVVFLNIARFLFATQLDMILVSFLSCILWFLITLVLSWIFILIILFLAFWFSKKLRVDHPLRQKIIGSMSKLIIRFFCIKVIVHNKHLIPLNGRLIIYSNHKNNFDPFVIASIFPRTISFTPKDELYRGKFGWFLSYYLNASNCIKITRGNDREIIQNILKSLDNIKKNLAIVVFHEGGVKNVVNDKISHSLDGSFQIALKSESNILPITLRGSYAMRGKCWFRNKKVDIFIHPVLNFENYKTKSTKEINTTVTQIINSVL
ncbi:MAG: lysophospholipid acyltransferase family protein [Phytoplasma sp.]|uniref:lysophospholipid acyltransferase family protein n=1 Tax=Phytoplasma sp. TaxID=2155 RepID=UPI002B40885F|nr:lysophospholipid acyltransferase family protein [Phytoplasma sp.]WRH06819.1 MAG: lysophospholipid acyltransferase family protein [Phytoplasma sp.]